MSWLYLPEQVADYSPGNCLVGEPSAMSSGIDTRSMSSGHASKTDTLTTLQSGMIVLVSTGHPGLDWWMSSLRASRANLSAKQEKDYQRTTQETDGLPSNASLAKYDLHLRFWKTFQGLFPSLISDEYLGTWPKSGTMRNGVLYRRPPLVRHISESDYGLLPTPKVARGTYQYQPGSKKKNYTLTGLAKFNLWPTPLASDARHGGPNARGTKGGFHLSAMVTKVPTPTVNDADNSSLPPSQQNRDNLPGYLLRSGEKVGGQLNPNWVEWLMGWPIGWTDLKPLEMDKFQKWLDQHGEL